MVPLTLQVTDRRRRVVGDVVSVALPLLLAVSVCINLMQSVGRNANTAIPRQPSGISPRMMPALPLLDLTGAATSIKYKSGQPTVLYYFSPACEWCQTNIPMIRDLALKAGRKFRFLGVSRSKELIAWTKSNNLGFPTYLLESRAFALTYGMTATPTTIVISADGRLLESWKGAYVDAQLATVERYFGVQLGRPSSTEGSISLLPSR
jgi:peroxiredoxin